MARWVARRQRGACQHLAAPVEQRYGVARQHLGGGAVAQQAVNRIFAQHHARKLALVVQRHLQLQQGRHVALGCCGLRVHGLQQVTRQTKGVSRVPWLEHLSSHPQLRT